MRSCRFGFIAGLRFIRILDPARSVPSGGPLGYCVRTQPMLRFVPRSQILSCTGGIVSRLPIHPWCVYGARELRRARSAGMIMTSYTSLVVQSHQADCAGLFAGISHRLTRRSPKLLTPEAYREHDGAVVHLGQPVPI